MIKEYKKNLYTVASFRTSERTSMNNVEILVQNIDPFPINKEIVGVMGPAGEKYKIDLSGTGFEEVGKALGEAILEYDCIMSNGACPGFPNIVAETVKKGGGYILGISPHLNFSQHIEEGNPHENYDIILFVGDTFPHVEGFNFNHRNVINVVFPDVVFSAGGNQGTCHEISGYLEQGGIWCPILTSDYKTGGATDDKYQGWATKGIKKDNGAKVIISDFNKPETIKDSLEKALEEAEKRKWKEKRLDNKFAFFLNQFEHMILKD